MDSKLTMKELVEIVEKLRSSEGCPWDRRQTAESLMPCMIEEVYELKDGVDKKDVENRKEELGDLLFLIVSMAAIAKENGEFSLEDVITAAGEKMMFRHPRIFPEGREQEQNVSWEESKRKEKQEKTLGESLKRIPLSFPAAIRAQKAQKKVMEASELSGYLSVWKSEKKEKWESDREAEKLLYALKKEVAALEKAIGKGENCKIEDNYGKMLFDAVGLACFLQLNAENSLTNATNKFINRFVSAESKKCCEHGKPDALPIDEILNLWNE